MVLNGNALIFTLFGYRKIFFWYYIIMYVPRYKIDVETLARLA